MAKDLANKDLINETGKNWNKNNPNTPLIGEFRADIPGEQLSNYLQDTKISSFSRNERFSPLLSELTWAYKDPDAGYIGEIVAPVREVSAVKNYIRAMTDSTFYNRPDTQIGRVDHPNKVEFGSSLTEYSLAGRALSIFMSDIDKTEAMSQWGSVAKWKEINVKILKRLLLLDWELEVADLFQTQSNFATNYYSTASPTWDNGSSTPKADVFGAVESDTYPLFGDPDTLVMGHDVRRTLRLHTDVKADVSVAAQNRSKARTIVSDEAIEAYFDKRVLWSKALYNSTPDTTTFTPTRIWANYVVALPLGQQLGGDELSPAFVQTLKLSVENMDSIPNMGGWSVKETRDEVAGMAGGTLLMCGFWATPKIIAQKVAYNLKVLT